jgi:1,4-dihydroxy-6-naphthoate synthase
VEIVFSEIENALINEEIDLGLIIHENRFTYAAKGLHKVIDLGSFWEQKTGSAIPLGGIVMSRKYDKQTLDKVNRIMARSVEFAMKNPLSSAAFVKQHAQEMEESVMVKHIQLYVNKYSLNLGVEGRKAVSTLLESAVAQGLILPLTHTIFID